MGMMTIDLVTGEVTTSEVSPKQERVTPNASIPFPQPALQPYVAPVATPTPQMPGGLAKVDVDKFIDKMQK
ncbi:MAG: hypothetical protein OEW08_02105 [Gammaproteobacteria bacterium]|nr:hypothetical protein [Gammaproteobacteria bacterium]